jgi:hypothetical protein
MGVGDPHVQGECRPRVGAAYLDRSNRIANDNGAPIAMRSVQAQAARRRGKDKGVPAGGR